MKVLLIVSAELSTHPLAKGGGSATFGEWVCYNMHQFDDKLPEVVEIPSIALAV